MGFLVCGGAICSCSFGAAPSSLQVTPENKTTTNMPYATIMDNVPMKNIMPFGVCTAPTNPAVAAAMGVPQPCVPVCPAPWAPGSPTVLINNKPALNNSSKLMCAYAGVISINSPGQMKTQAP